MLKKIEYSIFILILFQVLMLAGFAQGNKKTTVTSVARNSYAPNLYAENLNFQVTLVDLPGAKTSGSQWQTSYEIYFVSEADFDNSIQKIGRREPTSQDFSEKILLASGNFNKKQLQGISQRVVEKKAISFKAKIPNDSKTEFAKIIVFYTVKINDANLKQDVYRTSLFITPPFESNGSEKLPRQNLFLSFFVNGEGKLYTSNQERNKTDITW